MKFKLYPQLFDKHIEYVKKIDYNRLYYKHKADELKGRSLQKYNDFEESVKLLHKNMRLPKALLFITVYPFLLLFGSIVSALPKAGVRQAYSNAPVLFWLLSILLFLSSIALIFFLYKRKNFIAAMTELNETTGKEVDRVIIEDLNVPSNATKVCFIQRSYYKNKLKPSSVLCQSFLVFEDDFSVYIYWEAALFKILKSEYVLAEIINSKIVYVDTKPTVDYKSPEIKQYKIYRNSNNNGVYISKSFGRLLFLTDGETWSIDVPPFAFEPIKMLFEKQST